MPSTGRESLVLWEGKGSVLELPRVSVKAKLDLPGRVHRLQVGWHATGIVHTQCTSGSPRNG